MAKRVVTGTYVELDSTDRSSLIRSASLDLTSDAQESTNFGNSGWKEFLAGLKSFNLALEFVKDADLSTLDLAVWTAFSAGTAYSFLIRGTSAAVSTSNAEYAGSVVLTEWQPLGGAVGDVFGGSVSWQGTGAVTRATA